LKGIGLTGIYPVDIECYCGALRNISLDNELLVKDIGTTIFSFLGSGDGVTRDTGDDTFIPGFYLSPDRSRVSIYGQVAVESMRYGWHTVGINWHSPAAKQ